MFARLFSLTFCLASFPCLAGTLTLDFEDGIPIPLTQLDGYVANGRLNSFNDGRGVGFMLDFSGDMRLVSAVIYTNYEYADRFHIEMGTSGDCFGSDIGGNNAGVRIRFPLPSDLQCVQQGGMSFGVVDPTDSEENPTYTLWMDDVVIEYTGDTDMNGAVEISDLNNVRNHFGESGESVLGDDDGDGVVGIPDLNNVRNSFGAGPSAGSRVVPEPQSLLLSLAGFTVLHIVRTGTSGLRCSSLSRRR